MPVFLPNGPNVPDHLVRLHEEGKVVFFCGAGISYPAGLPGFGGLVCNIYKRLSTTAEDIEKEAIKQGRYDQALDLLEKSHSSGRIGVRRALAESLEPKWRKPRAKDTHLALLDLSIAADDKMRLVTTNFDRIFEVSKRSSGIKREVYSAPMLPIPKRGVWDGIVYLHGLLPSQSPSETQLDRLVVTSGDFGLAYLNERWASRFVSELLRGFTVCFVGYSIEDPVLRYMMDALAVDERRGERRIEAFAFGSVEDGDPEKSRRAWEAKGVTPIMEGVEKVSGFSFGRGNLRHSSVSLLLAPSACGRAEEAGRGLLSINREGARSAAS